MKTKTTTAERILDASRRIFNEKGYAATTLTEIAADLGISQGNLTYHFPTKRALVERLEADARERAQIRRSAYRSGKVADDYVEHLLSGMELTWNNRFLLRDRAQYYNDRTTQPSNAELTADFEELHTLIKRIRKEGMLRRDFDIDLTKLTRALWIVSRYWMDYLRESEGVEQITWADQERGIQHHFAVLLPCLTAAGHREFQKALARAPERSSTVTSDT